MTDASLKNAFESYSELYEKISKQGLGNNIEDWHGMYVSQYISHVGYTLKGMKKRVEITKHGMSISRTSYEREYGLHQRIFLFLPDYKRIKISEVDKFAQIESTGTQLSHVSANIAFPGQEDGNNGLEIEIPEVNHEAIKEKASALGKRSTDDVSGFGNDVAIEAAAIVSKLSYYFTQQAAKPNHTLALVEDIIEEAKNSAQQQFVDDDPSWWEKNFSRPQLMPADKMPLAKLVEKSMALPNMAAADNESFGQDLAIADHAMEVLGAYHSIMAEHKKALEEEKERLIKTEDGKDDLISAVVGAGMKETVERTLQRIDGDMAFIKIFATNFFDISRLTAESRQNLSGIAGLAAVIQTPAMNAIGQFQAYQLRRFRQFGKAINAQVKEQFGAIANDVSAQNEATPDNTQKAIEDALGVMIERLEELPNRIMPVIEQRTTLAEGMQKSLLKGPQSRP